MTRSGGPEEYALCTKYPPSAAAASSATTHSTVSHSSSPMWKLGMNKRLDPVDDHLRQGRHEAVEHPGADDVEDGLEPVAAGSAKNNGERDRDDGEDDEDGDQLPLGHGLDVAVNAAIVTKMPMPPTHSTMARDRRALQLHLGDPRVQDRGDHQRDGAERLHHDERREAEARELERRSRGRASPCRSPRTAGAAAAAVGGRSGPDRAWRRCAPPSCSTPRCWNCAPSDRNTAPTRATRDADDPAGV